MSVSLCPKKAQQSHHQCASKRSGSVGNRGELAPLNQARGAQSTKSCLGGTKLCKAQNCSKHKIVQSTEFCKTQNCAKHKSAQSTKFCKAQNCSTPVWNTWTLVCRLELFLLCNFKRLCNSSRQRGCFAMDPLFLWKYNAVRIPGEVLGESMFNAGAVVAVSMPGAATSTLSPNPLPITYLHLFSLTLPPWIHF